MQWQKMLIIDLECTCFRDDDADKPAGWTAATHQEITEMGCVIVNLPERRIETSKSFLVQPVEGPMGVFCRELTTLTFDDVKNQPTLETSIKDLKAWCKENKFDIGSMPWASWGDYDRVQFFRETARKHIKYPFGRAHNNIKGMFSMMLGRKKGFGVGTAADIIGRPFVGTQHRGIDDAQNIAEIFLHVLRGCK